MNQNSFDKKTLANAFGWSYRIWAKPFLTVLEKKVFNANILEIGAGPHSIVSILFSGDNNKLNIGYYDSTFKSALCDRLKTNNCINYRLKFCDIHNVNGKYDLILLKSVLGGVCRVGSSKECHQAIIQKLLDSNIVDGGQLITIDNGKSFFEPLIRNFGGRKNKWRFFCKTDFTGYSKQAANGFLSAFCLGWRFGPFGTFFDSILNFCDSTFFKSFQKYPTVICTSYKK